MSREGFSEDVQPELMEGQAGFSQGKRGKKSPPGEGGQGEPRQVGRASRAGPGAPGSYEVPEAEGFEKGRAQQR